MRTTDNNGGKQLVDLQGEYKIEDLRAIANKNLKDLQHEHPDLLAFPQSLGQYCNDIDTLPVFSLQGDMLLTTYNLMGFIGRNNTQLTIFSRFSGEDNNDYFLHYMLQKVFAINIFKFDQTPSKENIWDFLLYLFPNCLKKAYSQGLYKAYRRERYSNANVKGTIDVKRHIRINVPFAGKIAYTAQEHSYDNYLTQLIRHTIEHIKVHPLGEGVLSSDSDTRDIVSKICLVTQNSYKKNDRQKVINANLKPVTHPYFTEYKTLQKICLRILRREKLTFGQEKDKIYGLLFNGAWLWEEYLNTVFERNKIIIDHPRNKKQEGGDWLLENKNNRNIQRIYPDFISKDRSIVADAKYKRLENGVREDYFQLIAYMYRYRSPNGFLLFPYAESNFEEYYTIKASESRLTKLGLGIPQKADDFRSFIKDIQQSEQAFIQRLNIPSS
jgi:5-methylcytosine-specific restriction endonuclease McrBC regulatory subunit McrC